MYDTDSSDRIITETICLDIFFNGLSLSGWKYSISLMFYTFIMIIYITWYIWKTESIFLTILLFLLMP